MTSVYKESKENFPHNVDGEHWVNNNDTMNLVNSIDSIEQQFKNWRQQLQDIIQGMRQVSDIDRLFKFVAREIREKLACDRVLIYRFISAETGTVLVESKTSGWTPAIGENISAIAFGLATNKEYLETIIVNNTTEVDITPYQLQLFDKFQVKTSLSQPIFVEDKVWGLLVAHNCLAQRQWQEVEITLLSQIATELTYRLQSFEFQSKLQQQQQQQKSLIKVIDKIRQASDVDTIFKTTTQEVRQLLQCDRVAVYRFNSDWSGAFIAESVASGWVQLVGSDIKTVWEDTHLQETQGGRNRYHETFIVNDIYQVKHTSCHIEVLEQFEVKAYLREPIFKDHQLWGLVAAYQNSEPRHWEEFEVNVMTQIGVLLEVAIQQADSLAKLQVQSQEQQLLIERVQLMSKIFERIRESSDLDTIFRSTVREVRSLLNAERVAVFRFIPESGYNDGIFVAEDALPGYSSVLKAQIHDHCFGEQYAVGYREGRIQAVADIHNANFTQCHIDILTQFHIRANLIVPLIKGDELWGLLCIHHCSAPREWQDEEITLVKQIAEQFSIALQKGEYLQQLQTQSAQLAEAATREKAAKELLQKGAVQLLAAVRSALNGDLTVRAPLTEDELGTIADAYNNTLQALRQIVIQVQAAAQQVASTSRRSDTSLGELKNLANLQSTEITEALGEIQQMLDSSKAVAISADLVQIAVQQANQTVVSGDTAMNSTVEAIQAIRETVAQTSKKIKRLNESSQKISKVVSLISNFATQTNVLALNAAIEATRAGEYGKGFAVVADEVRSLSRQSAAATIEIEKLVQEIQTETGEVAMAMETGIKQVVEGTNLVSETRQNLNAMVAATAEITKLLQQITEATQTQTLQSTSVTTSMKDVAEIANKTTTEVNEIAAIFQHLSNMAQDLLANASKFKVE
ncbi:GAF domain-containing protein [Chlorogloeopsis sp. ULAP01]|uniref:GAF domain-containing protein n=1 Tax=Chlorogloeopsis sp. ULAP01 TaxID=3056483 RepID=UPI0025AB1258|nr:GAF domain-containing protein [Chlorogloeopsis sp. ULAP01]MDM9385782.1 GAF domain-containing protein [Chlorogloeopsis sp. ULAP01]